MLVSNLLYLRVWLGMSRVCFPVRAEVFAEDGVVRLDNFPPLWVLDERERKKLDSLLLDHW